MDLLNDHVICANTMVKMVKMVARSGPVTWWLTLQLHQFIPEIHISVVVISRGQHVGLVAFSVEKQANEHLILKTEYV